MNIMTKFSKAKFVFIIAFIIAVIGSPVSYGQAKDSALSKVVKNERKTLICGINSENQGLAHSAIYLAGYYRFEWAVEPLAIVLNNPAVQTTTRVLAAYSLYMIGDPAGMESVKNASMNDENYIVRGMCKNIYNDYVGSAVKAFTSNIY